MQAPQVVFPKSELDIRSLPTFIPIEKTQTAQVIEHKVKKPSPIRKMIVAINGIASNVQSEVKYADPGLKILREEKMMKDGKLHGIYKRWYDNGRLCEESLYANGLLNGKQYYYNTEGILIHEFNFKNGNLDGQQLVYYKDGKIRSRKEYANGIPVGQHVQYYEKGILRSLESFNSDGLLHGVVRTWHKNGHLSCDSAYINGKLHGMYFEYNDCDVPIRALYLEHGCITGVSIL